MMALFLVMWLVASVNTEQRAAIFEYFKNPSMESGRSVKAALGSTALAAVRVRAPSICMAGSTRHAPSRTRLNRESAYRWRRPSPNRSLTQRPRPPTPIEQSKDGEENQHREAAGLATDKVARIVGLSSSVLFDKDNPHAPINRRISVILMTRHAEEQAHLADVPQTLPAKFHTAP
jgi:flagellar motor protein MotB